MEMMIRPKRIDKLTNRELDVILKRSMSDISSIYGHVRDIVEDVRLRGDAAILDANREFKSDITALDLRVDRKEVKRAYKQVK